MRDDLWENTTLINQAFPFNIFENTPSGNQILKLHWHEHYELILIDQGEAVFQLGANQYQAKAGDLLFVNSGELHGGYREDPSPFFKYYAIVFHPSLVGHQSANLLSIDLMTPYIEGKTAFTHILAQNSQHYPQLISTITALIREFQSKQLGYEVAIRAYCQLIFTWLCRGYTTTHDKRYESDISRLKAAQFKEMLLYIEKHFTDRITLKQVSDMVHLSPYHFCKIFKKLTGLTLIQYINLLRIYEAEKLLRTTTSTITDIAEQVGCGSINSFSKIFKQYKGCSPMSVRQSLK
jgi:AraC family transcriptional activator of pobA